MRGPDGKLRDCYPVVMSFMVDYPEACLICLIRTNHACPVCMARKQEFSHLDQKYTPRTVREMKKAIANATSCFSKGENQKAEKALQENGLRGQTVCKKNVIDEVHLQNSCSRTVFSFSFLQNALWELPYTNIYSTITPDMLHQVKKGVWEHLVNLTIEIIKRTYDSRTANQLILELDLRVGLVPRYSGLRNFSKGISSLSQITGAEYQQIMRVCLLFYNLIT